MLAMFEHVPYRCPLSEDVYCDIWKAYTDLYALLERDVVIVIQ